MARSRSAGVVGATSATSATPSASHAARSSALSSWGRSGTIRPLAPACGRAPHVVLHPAVEHHVGVDHQHHRQAPGGVGADVQDVVRGHARVQRLRAGRVDHRAVGQRVGEGHAQLDQVGPGVGGGGAAGLGLLDVRVAAHQVGHQRRAAARAGEGGGQALDPGLGRRAHSWASTSARSLSPRPESTSTSSSPAGLAISQASACEGSSAGMMPSRRASLRKAATASASPTAS